MSPEHPGPDELMRYLDGEASPEERSRVEERLGASTELQRELAIFRAMKADFRELSFQPFPPDGSIWGAVNRRLARPLGWTLLIVGIAVWSLYGSYLYLVSSTELWEKLATAAIVIGIVLLLAGVIWEQYRAWLTDPYKDVQR